MKYPILLLCLVSAAVLAACAAAQPTPGENAATSGISLTSPAFSQAASIPQKYTCQGDDSSPELQWSAPPAGAQSLALLVEDPDAPGGTWVHWLVYNLPAQAGSLPEGASKANTPPNGLPDGAVQGKTSFGRADYGGPCPPSGEHHYYFRLYALDTTLDDQNLDKTAFLKAIEGHVLAQGELMGLYKKQ